MAKEKKMPRVKARKRLLSLTGWDNERRKGTLRFNLQKGIPKGNNQFDRYQIGLFYNELKDVRDMIDEVIKEVDKKGMADDNNLAEVTLETNW